MNSTDLVMIIIGILGAVFAFFAAKYARDAWLKPAPLLECSAKAIFIKTDDDKYILRLQVWILNVGAIPAVIKRISVRKGGAVTKEERYVVTDSKGESHAMVARPFTEKMVTVIGQMRARDSMRADLVFGSQPGEKVTARIHTPTRVFKVVISKVREVSRDDYFDFLGPTGE